jgi:hypothetical protein
MDVSILFAGQYFSNRAIILGPKSAIDGRITVRSAASVNLDFDFCPLTLACTRSAHAGIQDMMLSVTTLRIFVRPGTRAEIATQSLPLVRLYRILQLAVFD